MIKNIIATTVAFVGIASAGTALAYDITYGVSFGQSGSTDPTQPLPEFEAALEARKGFFNGGMPAVQDFESVAVGTTGPLTLKFGSGDTEVNATLGGTSGKVVSVASGATDEGRYSVGAPPGSMGNRFWETRATNAGSTFELWFDNPVVQFGFFGIDIGDFGGVLELEILGGAAGSSSVLATLSPAGAITGPTADGSILYFGVTASGTDSSEWFRGVRFRSYAPTSRTTVIDDVFAFDSFTVVAAPRTTPPSTVPTPGTLALLGTALMGLALLRRRA